MFDSYGNGARVCDRKCSQNEVCVCGRITGESQDVDSSTKDRVVALVRSLGQIS